MKHGIANLVLTGTLALGLLSCGGVRQEAKVATALQSMMVLSVEAAIRYSMDNNMGGVDPLACSVSGTYQPNASLASLISFLSSGGSPTLSGYFTFNDCKMKLCGDTITLNGESYFEISASVDTGGTKTMLLTIKSDATNQLTSTGIITSTAPAFEYQMAVEVTDKSLKNVTVQSAATPLQYQGKVYRATEIKTLANGC